MQILNHKQNSEEWYAARKGKITGSTVKDVLTKRGNSRKVGFYQLIADRLAIEADGEDVMERGHRLEADAAAAVATQLGVELEQDGMWVSDDNPNIAVSPDRVVIRPQDEVRTAAVEIKCLSSARHIQNILEDRVPTDHYDQVVQYFIVNDDLNEVHYASYDPRVVSKPLHIVTVSREDVADDIEKYKEMEAKLIAEVEAAAERLAF